jgi:hypothetical protein
MSSPGDRYSAVKQHRKTTVARKTGQFVPNVNVLRETLIEDPRGVVEYVLISDLTEEIIKNERVKIDI